VLHGQPADYLLASLKAYAEGRRRSGIMQPLAADLRPEICVSLQTTMRACRHHICSQKTQMQLWWSAAENWLSKVGPTLAFCRAQRVTTMLDTILAFKVSMRLIWRGNCGFGKQASARPQTAGLQ